MQECGIGRLESEDSPVGGPSSGPEGPLGSAGAGHRVLVFAQLKSLLELVERDVLQPGGVSSLRLDGRSAPLHAPLFFPPPKWPFTRYCISSLFRYKENLSNMP